LQPDSDKRVPTQTPAPWRALRTRVARPGAYDEDFEEDEDRGTGGQSSEGEDLDGLEDEEGLEEAPRYSRRVRNVVQRFVPPAAPPGQRPRSHALRDMRDGGRVGEDDSDGGEGVGRGPEQPSERFSMRYSARDRRTVERFNPLQPAAGPGGSGEGAGAGDRKRRDRPPPSHARGAHSSDDDEGEEEHEEEGGGGGDDGRERRQYAFRDRALVTIKPSGRYSGGDSKRHRPSERDRERDRARGGGGRRRYDDGGDLLPPAGGTLVGGGGHHAAGGAQPWELALAAAGLGPAPGGGGGGGFNGAAAAGGGGGGGAPSSAAGLEIAPLEIDQSVGFDSVGGLDHYVRALKEMVFLPLVYPELFDRFHVSPPRGVLFYGPPGTGKTLVARALAAHASRASGGRAVSFFMRKGADVLSKWVHRQRAMKKKKQRCSCMHVFLRALRPVA
jgi:hypothetical protein